jgi:hypothetical protein
MLIFAVATSGEVTVAPRRKRLAAEDPAVARQPPDSLSAPGFRRQALQDFSLADQASQHACCGQHAAPSAQQVSGPDLSLAETISQHASFASQHGACSAQQSEAPAELPANPVKRTTVTAICDSMILTP